MHDVLYVNYFLYSKFPFGDVKAVLFATLQREILLSNLFLNEFLNYFRLTITAHKHTGACHL